MVAMSVNGREMASARAFAGETKLGQSWGKGELAWAEPGQGGQSLAGAGPGETKLGRGRDTGEMAPGRDGPGETKLSRTRGRGEMASARDRPGK